MRTGIVAVIKKAKESSSQSMRLYRSAYSGLIVLVGIFMFSFTALAYRPFIGTDAAVAEKKKTEVELGFDFSHDKENEIVFPDFRFNYGFIKDWEIVAESGVQIYKEGPARNGELKDPAISLKGIVHEGILQDKKGLSAAWELGVLLPSTIKNQRNAGLQGTQIISGKLKDMVYHINAGMEFDRENFDPNGLWGIILEYPYKSPMRLVSEFNGQFKNEGFPENSGLIGMIWTVRNITLDFGARKGFSDAAPDWQLTTGVTFAF